jgi:squalene cyclase
MGQNRPALQGIDYLLDTQAEDGTWAEEVATGTGFPKVFYLNYLSLLSFVLWHTWRRAQIGAPRRFRLN